MWFYYQTVEHGKQEWQLALHSQFDQVKQNAYHLSIYQLDKLPETTQGADIKYKGDFWIDIDHKPLTDSPEQIDAAIQKAILDMQRLLDYLESIKLDLSVCSFFATGSKGFHLCIPGKLFGAGSPHKNLPKIHKQMAIMLVGRAGVEGLDLQLYASGKGKLLRVENKLRANHRYKVPVTALEIRQMTPESYAQLTKQPRLLAHDAIKPPELIVAELAVLFEEARADVDKYSSVRLAAVSGKDLADFQDKDPTCIDWLVHKINVKDRESSFNRGKMSLARYFNTAVLSTEQQNRLAQTFFSHWETQRNKQQELDSACRSVAAGSFSCQLFAGSFTDSPCRGCPVKQKQVSQTALNAGIEVTERGYFKAGAKGAITEIANFTLKPKSRYVDNDDLNDFLAFDYDVEEWSDLERKKVSLGPIHLTNEAWISVAEFKRQIKSRVRLRFTGNDTDLQHLKSYLTSVALIEGVTNVRVVKTVGMYHHKDLAREINEYVWVETDWSINAQGATNTVKYGGQLRTSNGVNMAYNLPLRTTKTLDMNDTKFFAMFDALLNCNLPYRVGVLLGWNASCWLRPQFRSTGQMHLPVISLYGAAGSGKTESAALFSFLGGAEYLDNAPSVASGATPYALICECAGSSTVPRIIDELNEHKIGDRRRYTQIVEMIKASVRASAMPQGLLQSTARKGASVVVDDRPILAPIIFIGTNRSEIVELKDRMIELDMAWKSNAEKGQYAPIFRSIGPQVKELWPLAKALMSKALITDTDWVSASQQSNAALLPPMGNGRVEHSWQVVLVGLDFLIDTLKHRHAGAELINKVERLKQIVLRGVHERIDEITDQVSRKEADNIMDCIGNLAAIPNKDGDCLLKDGLHYVVYNGTLHLFATAAFMFYARHMRESGLAPECATVAQFKQLLINLPYFKGDSLAPGVPNPKDWYSFDIQQLKEAGIQVERFKV